MNSIAPPCWNVAERDPKEQTRVRQCVNILPRRKKRDLANFEVVKRHSQRWNVQFGECRNLSTQDEFGGYLWH